LEIEKWGDSPFEEPLNILRASAPGAVASRAGCAWEVEGAGGRIVIPSLGHTMAVRFPDVEVEAPRELSSFSMKLLTLLYLSKCTESAPAGNWVAYRELPNARFYEPVVARSVEDPVARRFGADISGFEQASCEWGGRPEQYGDSARSFELFPKVAVLFILWRGDSEFPARASVLFDDGASRHLNAFDLRMGAQEISSRLLRSAGPP